MFIPNNTCLYKRKLPGFSGTGDARYAVAKPIRFSLVRYDLKVDDSTVRADSSATRGNVKEFHASGRILVPVSVAPNWGDLFIIDGQTFKAGEVEPRYDVLGHLDHFEVDTVRERNTK